MTKKDDDTDEGTAGNGRDTGSQPRSSRAEEPFRRQREFDHAMTFIKNSHFGVVAKKARPYSRQVKDEAERLFPVDIDIYADASHLQRRTNARYITMRVFTLTLFAAFTGLTYLVLRGACTGSPFVIVSIPGLHRPFDAAVQILAVGLVLGSVRWGLRKAYFFTLRHLVEKLAFGVKRRYASTVHDCKTVANEMGSVAGAGDWPLRARKSMIVALWHAIRADYLDRYATTVLWKTETFFQHAEWFFWGMKLWMASTLILVLGIQQGMSACDWPTLALGLSVYVAFGLFAWFYFNRQPNDFVGNAFNAVESESKELEQSSSGPYFFALADEIESLVKIAQRIIQPAVIERS